MTIEEPGSPASGRDDSVDRNADAGVSIPDLAAVLVLVPDAVIVIDEDQRIRFFNRGAESIFGYEAPEVLGKPLDILIPERFARVHREHVRDFARSPVKTRLMGERTGIAGVRKSGEEFPAEASISKVETGGRRMFAVVLRDDTERHRAEARARELVREHAARQEAEAAARRMEILADVSRSLAASLDFDTIFRRAARLAIPDFADGCIVYVLGADDRIERREVAHVDPAREAILREIVRRFPLERGSPHIAARVVRDGEAVLIESVSPDAREWNATDPEHRKLLARVGAASLIVAPLRARGRVFGAIVFFVGPDRQAYSPDDLALAREIGGRIALAADNARLHTELERTVKALREESSVAEAARAAAEAAMDRLERLHRVTASLSTAMLPGQVARIFVEEGAAAVGAVTGLMALLDRDGRHLETIHSVGLDPAQVERWRRFPLDAPVPLAEAVRSGEMVFVPTAEDRNRRYPALAAGQPPPAGASIVAIPLAREGEVIGGLGFSFPEPRDFSAEDRDLLRTLAAQCVQAIDRTRLFEAEREMRARAEDASRAKSQFLAVMSHELRTPLTAVIGYAELLSDGVAGPVTPQQKVQLARIKSSAWHLVSIIDEILSFSRAETGREEVRLEDVDVAALARDTLARIQPEAEAKGLAVRTDLPETPVIVRTDPAKLRQILLNLLGNAVKFTEQGHVALELEQDRGPWLTLRVSDTGPGIPPEHRRTIFEPFSQLDQSATRRKGGTGLGLAVSRRLITLLGGEITLDSTVGAGSTFTVRIPIQPPDRHLDAPGVA